jgi:hypothetical protein
LRIVDFAELKAYVDIFNERGHKGFKEPINPFFWWNHKWAGRIDDSVRAYIDDGLVIVLELENKNSMNVNNMLVFALCSQKNILKRIIDICKEYDNVIYNCEYRDRYKYITKKLGASPDGASSNGKFYYSANGGLHGQSFADSYRSI